jgi:hypothetical protein
MFIVKNLPQKVSVETYNHMNGNQTYLLFPLSSSQAGPHKKQKVGVCLKYKVSNFIGNHLVFTSDFIY